MLAPRVCEDTRRIVVNELDVGDKRGSSVEPFEQVVRQQRIHRHPMLERGDKRIDVVQALAGEDAFVEEILIDVGDRSRVRIDTGVTGIGAREERPGRAGHRDADARLQDAVPFSHASDRGIEARAIQRVLDDADEPLSPRPWEEACRSPA